MTGRTLKLDTFDGVSQSHFDQCGGRIAEAAEAARIAGYDSGYKTGWDDASRQSREDGERLGAEFARNIRDLSFTYFEARAHVLRSFEGFLTELLEIYVPEVMREVIGPTVHQTLCELAEDAASAPVLIRAAPSEAARLRLFLKDDRDLPFQVVDEASLAEGQVYIKLGAEERLVDLHDPLVRLKSAAQALSAVTERTLNERATG